MSPTIFKEKGFRFFFFSREESRMHMHCTDGEAKFWLEPQIELSRNYKLSRLQLRNVEKMIEVHYDQITNAWKKYFRN